jgi:hypothetical protein
LVCADAVKPVVPGRSVLPTAYVEINHPSFTS